jgi:D-alanyl-D-alanine carboxypeptidase (penicillin-binding protein 5/6)
VALENGNLDDRVKVSKRASSIWGSTIKLREGEELTLRELMYGMMLKSGNDAALAIAEHIGGTVENFAKMMNDKAKELGLMNTSFKTPHGLDVEGHYSTAYELAVLTQYALKNPVFSSHPHTMPDLCPAQSISRVQKL